MATVGPTSPAAQHRVSLRRAYESPPMPATEAAWAPHSLAHSVHLEGGAIRATDLSFSSLRRLNTTTSPSPRSPNSLPAASCRFGLWLTMTVFLPSDGGVESNSRRA